MKIRKIFTMIMVIMAASSLSACGTSVARKVEQGNQAYEKEAYQEAMVDYSEANQAKPDIPEPIYNLANTLYRTQAYQEAEEIFQQALDLASDELAQFGFYNLGNNYYQQKRMSEAIEAYKQALRMNPDDMDAKVNLELALKEQKEQEEQQNQQSQNEQSEQDQQEQSNDQGKEGEEQEEQNQQAQNEPKQTEQSSQGEQGQNNQSAQSPEGMTEEQAKQLLAAIGQSTQTLQEKLQEIYAIMGLPPEKDW
jgi:Ca-activated chloride channel homolog